MLNKARKLMEQRETMIADAREVLVVLGAEEMEAAVVTNKIVINKGKVVEVPVVKEVVKEVEVPVVKEIVKEVVKEVEVKVEDTATIELLRETIKQNNVLINDMNKELEANELLLNEFRESMDEKIKMIHDLQKQIKELTAVKEQVKEQPEQQPKTKEQVVKNYRLVKCGPNAGEDEILFIEKRRDNLHLWYGQIRIDNVIRNFHWSNELQKPVVYGVESLNSLVKSNELIRQAVANIDSKELTKYDMVPENDPGFGGYKARHYYGALSQGAYIYATPMIQPDENDLKDPKDTDIVFKGYVNKHAFVVWRNGEIRFRHYDYINSTKPFEKTPSKGFSAEQMAKDITALVEAVKTQFENAVAKAQSAQARRQHSKDNQVETQVEAPQADNHVEYDPNANINHDLANADIGGLF